jgi:segregation and condensation protein A
MSNAVDDTDAEAAIDATVSGWEDPPRIDRSDAAPVLAVDGFEGPLDWWLDMARSHRIDLAKLSIAALIEAFATALDTALARRVDGQLARWAAWTVMAATLTELWSRLLLPADAPAARAAVEEAEALRRHLLERARLGAAADWLDRRVQLGRDVFRRGQVSRRSAPPLAVATSAICCALAWLLCKCRRRRRRRCSPGHRPYGLRPMRWPVSRGCWLCCRTAAH